MCNYVSGFSSPIHLGRGAESFAFLALLGNLAIAFGGDDDNRGSGR
jgi:hypothetical protein